MIDAMFVEKWVEIMALDQPDLNPFGHRFYGDRRYRVWAIAGHGNAHHDTYYGHVGPYQFKLWVNRETREVLCVPLQRHEYFNI